MPADRVLIDQEIQLEGRIGLDLKDDNTLRVDLESQDDALFVGSIYLGAPQSQRARVIFDTGSEHLAVTGALCNDKTAGSYHIFEDNFSKKMKLETREVLSKEQQRAADKAR